MNIDALLSAQSKATPGGNAPGAAAAPAASKGTNIDALLSAQASIPKASPTPFAPMPPPTPLVKAPAPFDSTKLGVAKNTVTGLWPAAKTVGKYIYDQAIQTVLPGITPEEANDPAFLIKGVAPQIIPSVEKIGTDIMQHPVVSAAQIGQGTIKGALNFMSNALVNYIPGLVPAAEKKDTLNALNDTFEKALFPEGKGNLGSGFEIAGQVAPAILASEGAAGVVGKFGAGDIGKFGAGSLGFVGAGQSQIPSDATIEERAQNALDSLVQQGLFTAGSYGYHVAKGVVKAGAVNAYHAAVAEQQGAAEPVTTSSVPHAPLSPDEIRAQAAAGKTPTQIAYEMSDKISAEDAKTAVTEALQGHTAPVAEAEPAPAAEGKPEPLPATVTPDILKETPATIQDKFTADAAHHEENTATLKATIKEIEDKLVAAKPKSQEKKDLKTQLTEAKTALADAETARTNNNKSNVESFKQTLTDHINTELKSPLPKEHVGRVVNDVIDHIVNPDKVGEHANTSISDIAARVHDEHLTEAMREATGIPQHLVDTAAKAQGEKLAVFKKSLTPAEARAIMLSKFKTPEEFHKAANATRPEIEKKLSAKKTEPEGVSPEHQAAADQDWEDKYAEKAGERADKKVEEQFLKKWRPKAEKKAAAKAKEPVTRETAAKEYWDKKIAPLIKEGKAIAIGADDLKDHFGKDYDLANHKIYSSAANDLFERAVVETSAKEVKFTVGGTGAGKSDFLVPHASEDFAGVIYDSTGWNYEGISKQIAFAKEHGKEPVVYGVIPDLELSKAYTYKREAAGEHPVTDTAFARTHSGAIETMIKLINDGVPVYVLDTRGLVLKDGEIVGDTSFKLDPLAELEKVRYTEDNVREKVKHITGDNAEAKISAAKQGGQGGAKDVSKKDSETQKRIEVVKGYESLKDFEDAVIYHGTIPDYANRIERNGFKSDESSMGVSFAGDFETALTYTDGQGTEVDGKGYSPEDVIAAVPRNGAENIGTDGMDKLTGEDIYNPKDVIVIGRGEQTPKQIKSFYEKYAQDASKALEKIPRAPKPKGEPKAPEPLKPEPIFDATKSIAKNPVGLKRVLNEVATLFNPVGQADFRAVDAIMTHKGEYERSLFRTEQAFKDIKNMWDKQTDPAKFDFMEKVETGNTKDLSPELKAIADMYRARLDNAHKAAAKFKEVKFLDNFFPHFWEDGKAPEVDFYAKQNARRPFQGNKSFTKERVFATIGDGIKAGYKPVSTNPEELMQIYEQNVKKFVMANEIMADLKGKGFSKFVRVGGEVPEGFAKIEDSISKIYLNPNIKISEAYDAQVYDKLNAVIEDLGIKNERTTKMPNGVQGLASQSNKSIQTKFASPMSVIAHELGHQLDYKYGLKDMFSGNMKELRALADLRYDGHEVTDYYKSYVRNSSEKMAVMLEALVHAPEAFKTAAPDTYKKFTDFLASKPELKPILDIKPSLVLGVREDSVYAGGAIMSGEYWVQKDVARLINNHLSKNKVQDTAIGQGLMNVKNTLNAFQLGFSAFHLTMETMDTIITKFSIGLTRVTHGDFKGFGDMLGATVAPYTYFRAGQKFYNGDPVMLGMEKALFTGGASLRTKQYYKNTVFDEFMKSNREILGLVTGTHSKEGSTFTQHDQNIPLAVKKAAVNVLRLPLAAVEATMRPLFTYYIPRLKVGAFRDLYAAELERNSAAIQRGETSQELVARSVWNNVENRMGELNYDNLFWDKNLKATLMLTTRAVGWNLGTAREIGGALFQDAPKAAKGLVTGKGFDMTPKMAYTVSLFFLVATYSSIYQYLHTGQTPQSVKDLFYPKNGATDKSGEPYRIEFPTYLKDISQSGIPKLLSGDPFGAADNAVQMLKNKSAPELSMIFDVLNNRDFYGDMIRNPHDNTTTQAKQLALYLATQATPFTFQQQQNLSKGKSTAEQQVEAFFGLIKAPADIINSDYNKTIQNLYSDQVGGFSARTPEQKAADDQKANVVAQIKHGDYSGIPALLEAGIIKPEGLAQFVQKAQLTTAQKEYKGLSRENKAKLAQ